MTLLLIQIAIVMLVTLTCGWLSLRLGQSRVIGEIIGGILLGPSVFGRVAPHAAATLFPQSSFAAFEMLSTIGLVLFLFLIGTELEYEKLYRQRTTAAFASGMSILLPFAMGALLAHSLRIRFAPHGVGNLPFVLFLGIAMSITAFPVLARILEERGLQSTALGTTAILCAAVDDVVAWLLLALALALIGADGGPSSLPLRLIGLGAYLAVMLFVAKPLLVLLTRRCRKNGLSLELLSIAVMLTLASAAATQAIGVHPLFGAFMAGVCFPRVPEWQIALRARIDMIVSVLLLPLFFALTGMRTRLDLLNDSKMWLWAGVVLVAAVFGIGALLNTRGLVELVVLNIAYNVGAFSPTLFTMMVVMALMTTVSTTPILSLLGFKDQSAQHPIEFARPLARKAS
jgi:Kef-type K+ transport system membrane component KefB